MRRKRFPHRTWSTPLHRLHHTVCSRHRSQGPVASVGTAIPHTAVACIVLCFPAYAGASRCLCVVCPMLLMAMHLLSTWRVRQLDVPRLTACALHGPGCPAAKPPTRCMAMQLPSTRRVPPPHVPRLAGRTRHGTTCPAAAAEMLDWLVGF